MTHWQALVAAVSDWRLWCLSAGYMTIIGSYSLSYFYPTLVNGLGYSSTDAQFMTAPLFVVAFAIAVPTCIFADRIPAYRPVIACVVMVLGSVFCALSAGIYAYVPRYVFLCFINSAIWTANPLALSFASTSLAPVDSEVRAISLAWINGLGNLAQIYGKLSAQTSICLQPVANSLQEHTSSQARTSPSISKVSALTLVSCSLVRSYILACSCSSGNHHSSQQHGERLPDRRMLEYMYIAIVYGTASEVGVCTNANLFCRMQMLRNSSVMQIRRGSYSMSRS